MGNNSKKAVLSLPDGQSIELDVIEGSENEKAVDLSTLRRDTGYITLDPGYVNTGSCQSSITFIDGEKGILRYRGYPIEELAEHSTFLETSYLLIHGKLPNKEELHRFVDEITRHTLLHEDIKRFYDGFPKEAHPMAILASVVCSLSTFYEKEEGTPAELSDLNAIRLLAKLPTIAAFAYKKSIGQPFIYPDNSKSYSENFLRMMHALPVEEYEVNPEIVKTLDLLLVMHADHEQNCSASTVRMVRSSMSNLYACISSGICALWGHRHGGANQRVVEMLESIVNEGGNVKRFVERARSKEDSFRLFGFGHRVYKNFDPRAKIIKEQCHKVVRSLNLEDPLLDVALELEEAALSDSYFMDRKLYPNVDFYSGILYRVMGIPVPAFPVMFAIGRLPGWIAQAREFAHDPVNRIGRPRQVYTGPTERRYEVIDRR